MPLNVHVTWQLIKSSELDEQAIQTCTFQYTSLSVIYHHHTFHIISSHKTTSHIKGTAYQASLVIFVSHITSHKFPKAYKNRITVIEVILGKHFLCWVLSVSKECILPWYSLPKTYKCQSVLAKCSRQPRTSIRSRNKLNKTFLKTWVQFAPQAYNLRRKLSTEDNPVSETPHLRRTEVPCAANRAPRFSKLHDLRRKLQFAP